MPLKMPVLRQFSQNNPQKRSNEEFIFIRCGKNKNTVQTSWRPQLPLPKEPDNNDPDDDDSTTITTTDEQDVIGMERHHHPQHQNATTSQSNSRNNNSSINQTPASNTSAKKWSFGRLFRRKKDIATDSSSEEDRKAGFTPIHRSSRGTNGSGNGGNNSTANLKSKSNKTNAKLSRSSKLNGASFDHIVINPQTGAPITPPHPRPPVVGALTPHADNEFFLPVETISPSEAYYQNQQAQYLQQKGAQPMGGYSRSSNSLDRRAARAAYKTRSAQRLPHETLMGAQPPPPPLPHSSSEEEIISLNSSTFSKYRSDESIHSGGVGVGGAGNNGQSRRSRAARNERYYKRLSRDGEPSSGQVPPVMYAPQPAQRWKTQPVPLSIYNPQATHAPSHNAAGTPRLRNTSSLQNVAPYVQWGQLQQQQQQQQPPKNLQNTVNDSKRSISYDSHIHLQNVNGRLQTKPLPPPPPPRDPLRRVNLSGQMQNDSSNDLRPISYAFDQSGLPVLPATNQRLSGRCVSDDKIWSGPSGPHYQSVHSLNMPNTVSVQQEQQVTMATPAAGNTPHHRRFITRAERDAHPAKKSLPNGLEFHYVADATPRSRKPIHMLEPQHNGGSTCKAEPSSGGILRTTKSGLPSPTSSRKANEFWQRMDAGAQQRGRDGERSTHAAEVHTSKPRSISSSRVGELRAYPIPLYSEVQKPKREQQPATSPHTSVDEVDSIVCGSLHIKSNPDNSNANYVEIRNKDYSKSNSMPNQYHRRSGEIPNTPNKYDEYVAEKREQHHKPIFATPTPPQRKLSIPPSKVADLPIYFPRKKPANLEEAISELEAIYKSLGLTEPEPEPEPEPEKKERLPTPREFEKYALAHADDYDDEDSPTGEPDPIRDDVAYRNMQLANLQHKTAEKQPPFGIPIGPVVAAPQTDYLHVTPPNTEPTAPQTSKAHYAPDIVKDDLAVRALRKDPPGPKDKFIYPYTSLQKKNRATRTQSANIYNLIHRDAAKPSGGDLHSYLELTRNLDRAGSMSDLHKNAYGSEESGTADVPTTLALLRNLKAQEQQQQQQQQQPAAPTTPTKKVQIPFRHPSQGGAICALPEKLPSHSAHKEEHQKPPVPLPRKSLTPEPTGANAQMEDALNKIAKEAQEKSMKLTKELQELRKEALITATRPPKTKTIAAAPNTTATTEEERLEKDLQEIEAVSEAAKRCGKMLLDTLPDANEAQQLQAKPRKLHKEGKLIEAIDQVSEAANAVCEKILNDIVKTEPPVVVQEAVKVKNKQTENEKLVTPNLIKKLDPIRSEQIEAIAKRCMRQLSELAEDNPDYDNLNQELKQQQQQQEREQSTASAAAVACNAEHIQLESASIVDNLVSTVAEAAARAGAGACKQVSSAKPRIEEIDQIMQECEAKTRANAVYVPTNVAPPPLPLPPQSALSSERQLVTLRHLSAFNSSSDDHTTAPSFTSATPSSGGSSSNNAAVGAVGKTGASTTASSFSSSSDCLAKSSSPSTAAAAGRRRQSSSITSFNPYSSSDYIKSSSSDFHTSSTDPIKTFSTTSYDVQTTTSAATPNTISATTNSTFSYSPSPPLPQQLQLQIVPASAAIDDGTVTSDAAAASAPNLLHERLRSRSLSSPSQYNSSEELAMIFGIDEQPRRMRASSTKEQPPPTNITGKNANDARKLIVHALPSTPPPVPLSSSNHASARHTSMPDMTTCTTATCTATANANQLPITTNPQAVDNVKANRAARSRNVIVNVVNDDVINDDVINADVVNDVVDVDIEETATIPNMTTSATTPKTTTPNITSTSSISIKNSPFTNTQNSSSSTSSSSIRLSPSSASSKLHSIPELQVENANRGSPTSKLSPNFNKIYASKISILVDNVAAQQTRSARLTTATQCGDSLSSCEDETSSNPDSGNVSLADFPLSAQTSNVCIQLENVCNSRFEFKKSFVSEVRIESASTGEFNDSHARGDNETETAVREDFPPPPSEKELLDSLVEEIIEKAVEITERNEGGREREQERGAHRSERVEIASLFECELATAHGTIATLEGENSETFSSINSKTSLTILKQNAKSDELHDTQTPPIDDASVEESENCSSHTQNSSALPEHSDTHLIYLSQLVRSNESQRNNSIPSPNTYYNNAPESMLSESAENALAHVRTDLEHLRLAFNEILERNSNELDDLPSIVEEEEEEDEEEDEEETVREIKCVSLPKSKHADTRVINAEELSTPVRKCSIVIETPPLNLNISEVKISYNANDGNEESESTVDDIEQLNVALTELPAENAKRKEVEIACSDKSSTDTEIIRWHRPANSSKGNNDKQFNTVPRDDEKPSTSAAAAAAASVPTSFPQKRMLSIFGELQPVAGAAAADIAAGRLTTLEHVLLACSLGVITPTDLYTLCLIIVGMITLIAIVLF